MEPENKKEIVIGWWKFAGLQMAVILLLSLVFFSAQFYPEAIKDDYNKASGKWRKQKDKYLVAEDNMVKIDLIIRKYDDKAGDILPSELERLTTISNDIKQQVSDSKKQRPYYTMPNIYRILANKYIDSKKQLKTVSADGCPKALADANNQVYNLKNEILDIKTKQTTLCLKPANHD